MGNIRWGIVAGAVAFVFSLALGLVHGAGFVHVIVRALIFTAVFFGMGTGAYLLITSFMPELLILEDKNAAPAGGFASGPGSRVNITLGDTSGAALPDAYGDSADDDEPGQLADLISGAINPAANAVSAGGFDAVPNGQAIDQEGIAGYNNMGAFDAKAEDQNNSDFGSGFSMDFGEVAASSSDSSGELPNLGDFGGVFGNDSYEKYSGSDESSEPVRSPTGNKSQEFEGDFSPKEIALGIRTVLDKEK